ncbi:MAG: ATP-binding protein, partial [Cyanobacteria bacterium J06649_11]
MLEGKIVWLMLSETLTQLDGETVIDGLITDITQRKLAEAAIQQLNQTLERRVNERTAQLEAINKELETFAYSISHDLRSPIRQVESFVNLLQHSLKSISISQEINGYLNMIVKLTKRAGKMIDDLIEFSSTGRFEMIYSTVDMNRLVQEIKQQIICQNQDRTIIWDIESLPQINGDRTSLRIVWQNLIENAVKYTSYCDIAEINIGSSNNSSEVTFFIKDNGVGFDMRYVERIFGIFQRLH